MKKSVLLIVALLWAHPMVAEPLPLSPSGVKTLSPEGAIKPTGPWSLGTRAGDYIYIAGMRGIDPKTDLQVVGDEPRIRQAFANMKLIAESEGATLRDATRLVVYVTDMYRFRPIVTRSRKSSGARARIRRAPSSRCIGSTATISAKSKGRSTRR